MRLTGAKAVVNSLVDEGVTDIFGYPGAAISPFYDALNDSDIKHVLTRHEQAAAHAANGYSRASKKVGVCVATSGPGATNLITGIATAYLDSIPLVIITGQVKTSQIGKDVFQEVDILGATEPFVKYSYLVKDASQIPRIVKEAFYIANTGRPGPVLIDLPEDIQNEEIEYSIPKEINIRGYHPLIQEDDKKVKKIAEYIMRSDKPVICAGGGIINSNSKDMLRSFAEKYDIPVTTTLMGIGAIRKDNPYNLGMLGSHGLYEANYAIHHADLLLVLGARVGDRAMGKVTKVSDNTKVVHVDLDPAEIGKNIPVDISLEANVKNVLQKLNEMNKSKKNKEWIEELSVLKEKKKFDYDVLWKSEIIKPQLVLHELSKLMKDDDIATTEVGQNQIWAANHLNINKERKFISSGGLGTMGYGLPASIGAKVAMPDVNVINISGDGSFQMSLQELATIKANRINVKILIFNNTKLGMVRELQKNRYKRYCATCLDDNPDFMLLAGAYGIKSNRIEKSEEIVKAVKEMIEHEGPFILECMIDKDEKTL